MSPEKSLFERRLSETIAWCSLQTIESNPLETEEFRHRRALESQGRALWRRGALLEKRGHIQSWLLNHLTLQGSESVEELKSRGIQLMREGDVTSILPLNRQLRTPSLEPRTFPREQTGRHEVVEEVAGKRANLLKELERYPIEISANLAGGRLLAHEPDENVADGASQYQSKGHFDGDDAPPWDTWVCYVDRHLVAWVPPSLLRLAGEGIEVNCVDCIRWIEIDSVQELLTTK